MGKKYSTIQNLKNKIKNIFQDRMELMKTVICNNYCKIFFVVVALIVFIFSIKNRHKAQRNAKFYINKCRSASCMQGGLKQASA